MACVCGLAYLQQKQVYNDMHEVEHPKYNTTLTGPQSKGKKCSVADTIKGEHGQNLNLMTVLVANHNGNVGTSRSTVCDSTFKPTMPIPIPKSYQQEVTELVK